jgi:hypothetical protein
MTKPCDICLEGEVTHNNVLFYEVADGYNLSRVNKDICDKCFNELKPLTSDGARRLIKSQKMLDDEE